jgi:hypothetical protein
MLVAEPSATIVVLTTFLGSTGGLRDDDRLYRCLDSPSPEHFMNPGIAAAFVIFTLGLNIQLATPALQCQNSAIRTRGAAIRGQAGRRTICSAINRRTDRSPANSKLGQTGRGTGTGEVCGDLGTRQAARHTRRSRRVHPCTRHRQGNVQSAMNI